MSDDRERPRPEGSWNQSHETKLAPNVKPKLSQKEGNSKGDYWNKERPAKVWRSRSTDSERGGRGRRIERERQQGQRRKRGRSEEARRRDGRDGESSWRKKTPPEDDVEDTECAVCFCSYDNIFKTPKLLACGHTFCLECLARINVTSPELKMLCCPVCREVTELPHGQDLPRLGNNEDIISKLPPDMQRALSIRFKRSKGKLLLKSPPLNSPTKPNVVNLPMKTPDVQMPAGGDHHLSEIEQGIVQNTVVDVGRPPNRVRGRLRRLFRLDQCYYAVVASIITIAVALFLVAILAFVIVPNFIYRRPIGSFNQTSPGPSGAGGGINPGRP
ncbi:E3 ubiquitin-protein ligase RNF183 [Mastacembelus armatus]|uniref:Ring finger protein 183 n=1 Tax=Mastacembelus armatus TaxID=205130 RepID=A0A7N8Y9A8_9TELE|nr:RING finger protein 225-like [Mastacembelus armatus]XP_026172517.1 RING finger protein 225-like [Mastacembelus armatus]